MLKNRVEMNRRRLDFSEESSRDENDSNYLGFYELGRGGNRYRGEKRKRNRDFSSLGYPWGSVYNKDIDPRDKKKCRTQYHGNDNSDGLNTPMSVESQWSVHSEDSEEFDEKLMSLRFLILEAEEEMRRIVRGRINRHLEMNREANEKKREIKRRKREVLEEVNKVEPEAGRKSRDSESLSVSQEDSDTRKAGIESFADFETSMFPYKSKNGVKSYVCPYEGCTMELPTLSRIKRHYIVHTRLRPFKCLNKDCNKRFSRKDNMLQHYKIHCSYSNYK
ncbi:putative transcriptional activator [Encephalitozoon intestinalis ATCC 50506]|uniref:Transcriptional activator n=1 Tax=Encephalitozoon intestinalis (strain ATCC 50506) TaxID=876142 RepID=E0S783_ENCIT|nr:putative transcriptional activator [Encephalitozoon intestinalis ATCC 50506]ADM11511.1 putative transcriptional activator [Encephalitozoon intestinalis ATCC 50506]UTX45224.1 hypothetical protein GPK93_05g07690 [Encephalitozoon intestinalis]